MPTLKQWRNFLVIFLGKAVYLAVVFYAMEYAIIKKNWPLYRCNPIYMPMADNMEENFVYCIQNMQSSFMGFLLEPLHFVTNVIGDVLGNFLEEINNVRAMFDKIRTLFPNIFGNIYGVFLNLVIEFQKITIGIEDLIGKIIGIITTLLYVMDGCLQTMTSAYVGPPGQMVMSIGKCFYPKTLVKMKNGCLRYMCDIDLGDILYDGSVVESVMKINNKTKPIPLYLLKNTGENNENIYVTGSHYVFDKSTNQFIKVEDYKKAELSTVKTEWFSCLITSSHHIQIGKELFWDWEDYILKMNQLNETNEMKEINQLNESIE